MTFKIIHNYAPKYLTELLESYSPRRTLRSGSQLLNENDGLANQN